jgi:hypothetical protein
MEKAKQIPPNKEEFVAVPNHTEKIQSQVLAKIGRPLRFDHVEVSDHQNGQYRVNIWVRPESNKHIAGTISLHVGASYYLTVSDKGEIIHSNPPMAKLDSHA